MVSAHDVFRRIAAENLPVIRESVWIKSKGNSKCNRVSTTVVSSMVGGVLAYQGCDAYGELGFGSGE